MKAINQCDGCQAGMEVRPFLLKGIDTGSRMHYPNGKSYMVCTKSRYRDPAHETNPPAEPEEGTIPSSDAT